jgi:hypothetical protein
MKPKIALFLHQPKCSVQSGNGIMQSLPNTMTLRYSLSIEWKMISLTISRSLRSQAALAIPILSGPIQRER